MWSIEDSNAATKEEADAFASQQEQYAILVYNTQGLDALIERLMRARKRLSRVYFEIDTRKGAVFHPVGLER